MKTIRQPETKAIVTVDGVRVDVIYLKIKQSMAAHHSFELKVDHQTFDKSFFDAPEKKLALVNTKVIIDLQPGDDIGKAYVFSGLVTSVRMLAEEGMHGTILLTGFSNTIELERGLICQTYSNTNIYTIINEVTTSTRNLTVLNMPDWKADITFAIQYKESDFQFIRRILNQYKVQFHYNGTDLIVGPYPEYPVVKLTYDLELRALEVCSRLLPNEETNYVYYRDEHNTLSRDSPKNIDDSSFYLQQVSKQADYLTRKRKPNAPAEAYMPDMDSLIHHMNRKKVTAGAEMLYIRGESKCCDVLIGRLLNIQMPPSLGGQEIGTYRVYEVEHELDQNGRYRCIFEAVPADLKYLPTPQVSIPMIHPIEVECWSNEDPLGMGRVKVKFPFDERPCDLYIPVMTPDAGGNDVGLGPVNRGYTFIPERNDFLLLSFLDAPLLSSPVVIGSMYNKANSAGRGGGNNNIKTIITRRGHTIQFDDTKDAESITIIDRNSNQVFIDTANNNITVTAHNDMTLNATETMTFNAKNMKMNIIENMDISVGKNKTQKIGKNFTHDSLNTYQTIEKEKIELIGKTLKQTSGEAEIQTAKGDLKIRGAKLALFQGGNDVKVSKG